MKYIAIIDTDDFENFEFFEDGNGRYIHGIDAGAVNGEWIALYFKALEQVPCDNVISRQAAIDTIERWLSCDDYNEAERHIMRAMQSVLYDLPPVTPKEKTGHWIRVQGRPHHARCDNCNRVTAYAWGMDYCPKCGRKMVEQWNMRTEVRYE